MIGGEPEDKIKIRISLDLNRPQLEFSFDEMNFEVSGPILDRFKKVFTPGAQITIKGICTGYLMDVELNRCVVE